MKKKALRGVRETFFISVGLVINAFGWAAFLIPLQIVGGGITGLGIIIQQSSGFPVGMTYLLVNILLMLLAIRFLGARFGLKTIFGILGLSGLLTLFETLIQNPLVTDRFLGTVLGGVIGGFGLGIIFSQGGSTGGTDIIALILEKYTHLSLGRLSFYLNLGIIASSYLVFGSVEPIIYGLVAMAASAYIVDQYLEGSRQSVQLFVFSGKHDQIADMVTSTLGRGVTVFTGTGWFSQKQREVLMIILRKRELPVVMRAIKDADPSAFLSISSVQGVYGQGFDRIKL